MISFPENIILEDGRALLRPLQKDDLDFLLPFAIHEPELWFYSFVSPAGRKEMEAYIAATVGECKAGREFPFIIFDKAAKRYAGSSRFYDIQLGNQTVQLGYTWYGKDFQRTGLNRHCKLLMLSYAFETWGMERVEFRAHAANLRSVDAMKAIGCVEEGVLRSIGPAVSGGRRDSIVLSILKNEWLGGVKDRLQKKIHP
jgi:RimJ/RimL family protein N-acetyltransferase